MKFFTNKNIWTKIIIVLIFILLFEFVVAKPSLGADSDGDVVEFGGKLMKPIVSLIVTLGDGAISILHTSIMGTSNPLLHADLNSTIWDMFGRIFKTIIFAAAGIAFFLLTPAGIGVMASAAVGYFAASLFDNAWGALGDGLGFGSISSFAKENLPDDLYLPAYSISPEEIFQGKILLFNVDFFSEGNEIHEELDEEGKVIYYYYLNENGDKVTTSKQNIAQELRGTISKWYVGLRNIALVCMMIVLLYIGIRMLLSTLASDKAKYKQMLQDWLMGVLILFLMHYIMAFSVTLVNKLTNIVSDSVEQNNYIVNIPDTNNEKLSKFVEEAGLGEIKQEATYVNGEGETVTGTVIAWPTNLMGSLRLKTQLANWGADYIGYGICFVILVLFTVFFIFTYLRRVLYMAFLTLMAPLVAVTYPIDKITDGKAQGFDKWFKEYIFNLLIQPMHLLLYYILVTSAAELASTNVIYSIVAIGFMIPAEKLLRSFFGFEKAHTPGLLAGPAGAALTMSAINKLGNLGKGKNANSSKEALSSSSDQSGENKPRFDKDVDAANEMVEAGRSDETTQDNTPAWNEQLSQDQIDELTANGIDPGNQEYNQYLREHGIDPNNQEETNLEEGETNNNLSETGNRYIAQQNNVSGNIEMGKNSHKERLKRRANAKLAATKARVINGVKKLPGKYIRFAGKAAGAATLGTAGLIAGAATGDISKASQYTAAGLAAGVSLGGNVSRRFSTSMENGIPGLTNYKDPNVAYNEVYNGRKYEKQAQQEYVKNIKNKNQDILKRNFSEKKVEEMLKEGGNFERFVKNGVDNIDDIMAAQRMIDENQVSGVKEAIAVAKYAKRVGKDYDTTKAGKWRETFETEFKEKSGLSEENAKTTAKLTMTKIENFNKSKKKNYI